MIAEAIAVAAVLALVVVHLRLRFHRRRADRGDTANGLLRNRKQQLRRELAIAAAERDTAIAELESAVATVAELRAQVDEGLRWRNELRQASAEQESLLMKPHPNRSRRQRQADIERAAWVSQWDARFAAPAVTPPHEQDGDTQ
ncbi:hypothetical protein GCM10010112_56020 [Actinoplanes lobatus]|uniref:Uncharacterized protein n=1 Tax=Actinoplanes lobatus TaxID=113568 RepID=A0A7W7HET8_9ACTN|nr:hypothetical protein [Actinoplanes lobatus]MBB4749180.1 hypothetical protein [Actinoplanes lobatus]GGN80452.1 hypothetical protein GCM10010112_56020 [Actinoplanes lobatus]GIE45262.1 hypothetical protein Alo02nite_81600 [Actinoplanes lobatus]